MTRQGGIGCISGNLSSHSVVHALRSRSPSDVAARDDNVAGLRLSAESEPLSPGLTQSLPSGLRLSADWLRDRK